MTGAATDLYTSTCLSPTYDAPLYILLRDMSRNIIHHGYCSPDILLVRFQMRDHIEYPWTQFKQGRLDPL